MPSRYNNILNSFFVTSSTNPSLTSFFFLLFLYLFVSCFITQTGPLNSLSSPSSSQNKNSKFKSRSINSLEKYPNKKKNSIFSYDSGTFDSGTFNAIVFDAGSTGTRIHIFTFIVNNHFNGQKSLLLVDETFKQVKPGLSAYSSEPKKAAESIIPLLKQASFKIPKQLRSSTPLIVKATAGLRLLPGYKADKILAEVDRLLRSISPSYLMPKNAVSIMDGEDEGVFCWFTINFLLGLLNDTKRSVVALDLGGASTQITFIPNKIETFQKAPKDFIIRKKIFNDYKHLYTHSYLGFGLMSSRKQILLRETIKNQDVLKQDFIYLKHPCFPTNSKTSWNFENKDYIIHGTGGDCFKVTQDYVNNKGDKKIIDDPDEISTKDVYAISYFYDRAVDIGLINDSLRFGEIRVRDFYLAASKVCGSQFNKNDLIEPDEQFNNIWMKYNGLNVNDIDSLYEMNPFVCLDLSYITNLLSSGYKLDWNKKVKIINKLSGVSASWALGAAASLMR